MIVAQNGNEPCNTGHVGRGDNPELGHVSTHRIRHLASLTHEYALTPPPQTPLFLLSHLCCRLIDEGRNLHRLRYKRRMTCL